MTEKQIGKLKKTAQKNGLSVQDEAALRLVERQITFSYSCDSDADMGTISSHRADGVLFFGSIEECPLEPDSTIIRSCDGHSVTVCYGHKDLKVYVPVIFMSEFIRL